jgi:hypothetical protein
VRVAELAGAKDVSEWLDLGHDFAELKPIPADDWLSSTVAPDKAPDSGHARDILRAWLNERYAPRFRDGGAFWSGTEDRLVRPRDILPTAQGIDALRSASNVPRDKDGRVVENALPGFFKSWISCANGDLLAALPVEEDTQEFDASAHFSRLVGRLITTMVTLGISQSKDADARAERRSALGWSIAFTSDFSRLDTWQRLRTLDAWAKRSAAGLEIAFRPTLASQLGTCSEIADMSMNRLGRLCAKYQIGAAGRVFSGGQDHRAVILTPEFVAELAPDFTSSARPRSAP